MVHAVKERYIEGMWDCFGEMARVVREDSQEVIVLLQLFRWG